MECEAGCTAPAPALALNWEGREGRTERCSVLGGGWRDERFNGAGRKEEDKRESLGRVGSVLQEGGGNKTTRRRNNSERGQDKRFLKPDLPVREKRRLRSALCKGRCGVTRTQGLAALLQEQLPLSVLIHVMQFRSVLIFIYLWDKECRTGNLKFINLSKNNSHKQLQTCYFNQQLNLTFLYTYSGK